MKTIKRIVSVLIIVSIAASVLPLSASASGTIVWGAANSAGDGVRVRSAPGFDGEVLAHAMTGDPLVIIECTNDEWYYVNYSGTVGYVSVPLLDRPRTVADFNATGKVIGDDVNMRDKPTTDSPSVGRYNSGTVMSIIGLNEGWYKVRFGDKVGYIRSDLMTVVAPSSGTSPSGGSAAAQDTTLSGQVVDLALSFVGSKYVAGGASPSGFDCSGFTYYIYKQFGINLTRNASGQYKNDGVHIARSELQPGDLVYTSSNGGASVTHASIYIGDNKIVHAQTTATGVVVSRIDKGGYDSGFVGAKRVIG